MNRNVDYAIGRFVLMQVTDDGLSRLEGHQTYESWEAAERGVETYLRCGNGHKRITVLKIEADFWLDPKPKICTNLVAR